MENIIEIEIGYVKDRLAEQDISIELSKKAKEFLIEKGFDKIYGARPLKRTIQRFLEDPLAEEIISGTFKGVKGAKKAKIDSEKGRLVFSKK